MHQAQEPTASPDLARFFAVVPPGFEELARDELSLWWPASRAAIERGGLTFDADRRLGFALNRVLKIPTRLLLRLDEFPCRDFRKLFRRLNAIDWENWQSSGDSLEFSASSHRSRLRIKRGIEETCRDAYRARLKKRGVAPSGSASASEAPSLTSVLIRFVDDLCTLSIDCSGEPLYKRGLRTQIAVAPLRENIAASLLFTLEQVAVEKALKGPDELIDPMMGAGTFFLEARGLDEEVRSRSFAYESFAAAKAGVPHLTRSRPGLFSSTRFLGFERDTEVLEAARRNLVALSSGLDLRELDFTQAPSLPVGPRRWLVLNPPYGERLRVEGRLSDYYSQLFAHCERVSRPELVALIVPLKAGSRLKFPEAWQPQQTIRFSNGGLAVAAHVFQRAAAPP